MLKREAYSRSYLLFLTTAFVLMIVSQGVIHFLLSDQEDAGREINVASRQRTLVQQIAKLSLEIRDKNERGVTVKEEVKELKVLYNRWESSQRALLQGSDFYKIDGDKSARIEELYKNVNPLYFDIKEQVTEVIKKEGEECDTAIEVILQKDDPYLEAMNAVVHAYTTEQSEKVRSLRLIGWGLTTITLLALVVALRFIIRPVLQRLREQNEELVELNANLEKAGRIKSDFLANMSHEVRTPLNGIVGMADVLNHTVLSDEQREYVQTIQRSGSTLMHTLNDILDYSRIKSGQLELVNEAFDLYTTLDEVIDMMRPLAVEKKLELMLYVDPAVPVGLSGDGTRLKQVLINLLNNAIKFTEKGEVVVKVEHVLKEEEFHQLRFSIADTGIGLPKDEVEQLFQSFTQADTSNSRKYGGAGLGLAICKQIVQLMGGRIWAESEEGKGSTFCFTFVAEQLEADGTSLDIGGVQGMKALIVDDNTTNLKILVKQLGHWGVQATPFNSPELVIEVLDSLAKFDFCILDMQMPGIDGVELTRRIRAHYTDSDLPIIVLSSVGDGIASDAKGSWNHYLVKPVQPKRLLSVLSEIAGREGARSNRSKQRVSGTAGSVKDRKLDILLAEDNEMNQAVLKRNLRNNGYRHVTVRSGAEVLEKLAGQTFDVILLDLDGEATRSIETVAKIRKLLNEEKLPLLVGMSADQSASLRQQCFRAGFDDVLHLPVDQEAFNAFLMEWFPKLEDS